MSQASRTDAFLADLDIEPTDVRGLDHDPFFVHRVLGALPRPLSWTGLTPNRRIALLGIFHALALGLAYAVVGIIAPDSLVGIADHAHEWLTFSSESGAVAVAGGIGLVGAAAVFAMLSSRSG